MDRDVPVVAVHPEAPLALVRAVAVAVVVDPRATEAVGVPVEEDETVDVHEPDVAVAVLVDVLEAALLGARAHRGVRVVAVRDGEVLALVEAVAVPVGVLADRAPSVAVGVAVAHAGLRLVDQAVEVVVARVEAVLRRAGEDRRRVVEAPIVRLGGLALVGAVAVAVEVPPDPAPAVSVAVPVVVAGRPIVGVEPAVAVVVHPVGADLLRVGVDRRVLVVAVAVAGGLALVGAVAVEVHVEAREAVPVAVRVEVRRAVGVGGGVRAREGAR